MLPRLTPDHMFDGAVHNWNTGSVEMIEVNVPPTPEDAALGVKAYGFGLPSAYIGGKPALYASQSGKRILGYIERGDTVKLVQYAEPDEMRAKVIYKGQTGWVMADYFRTITRQVPIDD